MQLLFNESITGSHITFWREKYIFEATFYVTLSLLLKKLLKVNHDIFCTLVPVSSKLSRWKLIEWTIRIMLLKNAKCFFLGNKTLFFTNIIRVTMGNILNIPR